MLPCIANNRHGVTITTHAIKRDYLIWMTTVRQPTKRQRSCVLTLKYTCICVYWWTRQRIHNTLIVVDRYLRLMGDKTIPDSAEPRLESFYPPFVAGIDLPHQGVVDSYSPIHSAVWDKCRVSEINWFQPRHGTALFTITFYVHVDTSNKESMTLRCPRPFKQCLIYLYIDVIGILLKGMHYFAPWTIVMVSP